MPLLILPRSAVTCAFVSGSSANCAARRLSFAFRYTGWAVRNAATVFSTAAGSATMLR